MWFHHSIQSQTLAKSQYFYFWSLFSFLTNFNLMSMNSHFIFAKYKSDLNIKLVKVWLFKVKSQQFDFSQLWPFPLFFKLLNMNVHLYSWYLNHINIKIDHYIIYTCWFLSPNLIRLIQINQTYYSKLIIPYELIEEPNRSTDYEI